MKGTERQGDPRALGECLCVRAHVNACLGREGWAELRAGHSLSQEQGGAPPWSGLGLAAGWPGYSQPPRLNRPCLERACGEGGMLVPSQSLPCPAESFLCEWPRAEKGRSWRASTLEFPVSAPSTASQGPHLEGDGGSCSVVLEDGKPATFDDSLALLGT